MRSFLLYLVFCIVSIERLQAVVETTTAKNKNQTFEQSGQDYHATLFGKANEAIPKGAKALVEQLTGNMEIKSIKDFKEPNPKVGESIKETTVIDFGEGTTTTNSNGFSMRVDHQEAVAPKITVARPDGTMLSIKIDKRSKDYTVGVSNNADKKAYANLIGKYDEAGIKIEEPVVPVEKFRKVNEQQLAQRSSNFIEERSGQASKVSTMPPVAQKAAITQLAQENVALAFKNTNSSLKDLDKVEKDLITQAQEKQSWANRWNVETFKNWSLQPYDRVIERSDAQAGKNTIIIRDEKTGLVTRKSSVQNSQTGEINVTTKISDGTLIKEDFDQKNQPLDKEVFKNDKKVLDARWIYNSSSKKLAKIVEESYDQTGNVLVEKTTTFKKDNAKNLVKIEEISLDHASNIKTNLLKEQAIDGQDGSLFGQPRITDEFISVFDKGISFDIEVKPTQELVVTKRTNNIPKSFRIQQKMYTQIPEDISAAELSGMIDSITLKNLQSDPVSSKPFLESQSYQEFKNMLF